MSSRKSEKNIENNEKYSIGYSDNKEKIENFSIFCKKNTSQIFEKIEKNNNNSKLNLHELNLKIDKLQNKKKILEENSNNDNNKNYEDDSLENKQKSMKTCNFF